MTVQRKEKELIIKVSPDLDIESIQRFLNYLTSKEIIKKSKATQAQIDDLIKTAKKGRTKRILGPKSR